VEIFEGYRALFRPLSAPALAIGNFDGVHRGHMALLEAARRNAEARDADAAVFTFEPHPAHYFAGEKAPGRLTSPARKQELLAAAGMSICIAQPFDEEFSKISAEEFHDQVLHRIIGCKHVIVGDDFGYGHGRKGTIETLRQAGDELGYSVEVIGEVQVDGERASSSRIRELLLSGDVTAAARMLDRWHDVDGAVVKGAGRGRELGIPTANVDVKASVLPAPGIYAVWFQPLDELQPPRMGAASLGTNPTFVADGALTLEVHVLDFEGDLYDRRVRVGFVERLRDEESYDSVDALMQQIHEDIRQCRNVLQRSGVSFSAG
jgi:riboflavin kinase/FMN adenylyltransferase